MISTGRSYLSSSGEALAKMSADQVIGALTARAGGVEGTHAKTGVAQLLTFDAVRLERFFEWWPAGSPPSSYASGE